VGGNKEEIKDIMAPWAINVYILPLIQSQT
jgi:hypothetical protein